MITARGGLTALRGCAAPPLSRRAASRGCVPCAAVAAPRVLSAPPWRGRVRARWRFSASGRGGALPASASALRGMRRGAAPSRSGRGLCARWAGWRPSRAAPRFGPAGCGPPLRACGPCPRSSRAGAFAGLRPALSRARASAFWGWGSLGLRASDFRLRRKCHPPPAPPIREGRRRTPADST